MRLDGTDDDMFVIMIPQPNDRSLQGLQAYQPYELRNDGRGKSFDNNYMLLSPRNLSQSDFSVAAVREILSPKEVSMSVSPGKKRMSIGSVAHSEQSPLQSKSRVYQKSKIDNRFPPTKKRKVSDRDHEPDDASPSQRWQRSETPVSRDQQPTPASRDTTESPATEQGLPASQGRCSKESSIVINTTIDRATPRPSGSQHAPAHSSPIVIPPDLTQDQAKRVHVIWTATLQGDVECDFVHALSECVSFASLLDMLVEDSAQDPDAIAILDKTSIWRMTYQLPNGSKKAVVLRKGSELGFDRLQASLAQSPVWSGSPNITVHVELKAHN